MSSLATGRLRLSAITGMAGVARGPRLEAALLRLPAILTPGEPKEQCDRHAGHQGEGERRQDRHFGFIDTPGSRLHKP